MSDYTAFRDPFGPVSAPQPVAEPFALSPLPVAAAATTPHGTLRFVIEGEAVAKGRPRLGVVRGHAMAFTPKKTRSFEDVVRQRATIEWGGKVLIDGPVALELTFVRPIAASWSKKRQRNALLGFESPTGRPDLDNLCKAITDGFNGVVYRDDSLIWKLTACKVYGERPRTEVALSW